MRLIDADELRKKWIWGSTDRRSEVECIELPDLDDAPTVDVVPTKALRLFIEWADECGFGYDNIPDEYEKYKDDIKDMGWIEGFMYIVLKEAEAKE